MTLSIGIVGSKHEDMVYDTLPLKPRSHLGHTGNFRRKFSLDAMQTELEADLELIITFLKKGIFESDNGTQELHDEDRPSYERTTQLYREVLATLKGKR